MSRKQLLVREAFAEMDMAHAFRIPETAAYLVDRGYTIVTLQLPDELLHHGTRLALQLQEECESRGHPVKLYVLADTTYNSLSVDEVAAQHIGAQCVVHYGRASMTKLSRLPAFFVFPQAQLDVAAAVSALAGSGAVASSQHAVVFLDQPLLHLLPELQSQLASELEREQAAVQVVFAAVPHQHLEPEGGPPVAGSPGGASAGCCGGGRCGSDGAQASGQPLESQRDAQQDSQQLAGVANGSQAQPGCRGGAQECQAAAPSSGEAAGADAGASGVRDACGDSIGRSSRGGGSGDSSSREDGSGNKNSCSSLAGYAWQLPGGVSTEDCCLVWVGSEEAPALLQLQLTYSGSQWAMLDPASGRVQEGLPMAISRALKRRYFLVEKARQANIVGILVGTLGVAGYRDAIKRVRLAAQRAGKKTYTLLMGKPNPAKLANFPEIEVFVMISDPQGQILDSKEYLAPIITPWEAMLAFSPEAEWDERKFRLDFDGVLESAATEAGKEEEASTELVLRAQEALQITVAPSGRSELVEVKSAADYLHHRRQYLGLETPLTGGEEKAVEKAVLGRVGRAAGYVGEPNAGSEEGHL